MPIQLTSLIGREKEITDLLSLLTTHRLVSLAGPGGAGKTRLALQVASQLAGVFTDGAWLVDLAPLSEPGLIPQTIATSLHLSLPVEPSLGTSLLNGLRHKHLLLLLDNCEHLLDGCTILIYEILKTCPRISILATSREILGLEGEVVSQVPPLTTPENFHVPIDSIHEFEAVRLFADRAQVARAGFDLNRSKPFAIR